MNKKMMFWIFCIFLVALYIISFSLPVKEGLASPVAPWVQKISQIADVLNLPLSILMIVAIVSGTIISSKMAP